MIRWNRIVIIAAAAMLASGEPVRAEHGSGEDTLVQYTMKEIVVTARRIATPLEDLALSVSLIKGEEIDYTLKNSSTDLVGMLPGVFIMRTGDFGRTDVNLRGLGSKGRQALVLMDGRPETMGLFGCTVTHTMPLHDVERIEVVKGAASTLYGSGAMGGVMNVVPRRVRDGLEIDFKTGGSSYETFISSGRLAGRRGRLAASISADYRETAGHIENSAYRGTDILGRGEAHLSGSLLLSATAKYFDGYKEEPLRSTDDPSMVSDTWNDYKRGSFDLHLKGEGEIYHFGARIFRNFGEHEFSDGFHSEDKTDGTLIHARYVPLEMLEISGGGDLKQQWGSLPETAGQEWDKWEAGTYLNIEYTAGDVLTVSAGARYNHDNVSGDQTSPSFGAVWRPGDGTTVRCVAAQGFRSPQINELYMYPISNDRLEAERVWNYEVGLRQKMIWGLAVDLSLYRMDGENMIELADNTSPPPPLKFRNTGDFLFEGFEASLEGIWSNGVSAVFSWSGLDSGRWTRGRPGTKLDLDVSYTLDAYTIKLSGRHIEDYYGDNDKSDPIPSYTVLDIYGEGVLGGGISVFAGLKNIADEEYFIYTDLPGGSAGLYLMPGRTLTAGIKYRY
jgi:iron complex outermembrane receptor protein